MIKEIFGRKPCKESIGLAPGEIVVARLPEDSNTPYATWFHNLQTGGFSGGHYFVKLESAVQDFHNRT